MSQNGRPVEVVSMIQIALMPDGSVQSQIQGNMNRATFNMMIETAKQDLLTLLYKAERQAQTGIAVAPPGMVVLRNDS